MELEELRQQIFAVLKKDKFDPEEITKEIEEYNQTQIDLFVQKVIEISAETFSITVNDVKKRTNKMVNTRSRWFVFKFLKENTDLTLEKIGSYFGNDHSSVANGIQLVKNEIDPKINFKFTVFYYAEFTKLINQWQQTS